MEDIIVVGGGGHAKVVISILKKLSRLHVVGYTDLQDKGLILDIPYLGQDSSLAEFSEMNAVLAVGQVGLGHKREEIWTRIRSQLRGFPSIVSPHAIMNEAVKLGEGAFVMDGAVMNSGATSGRGVIVNTSSIIEHDTILEDWVHIAPGATISGGVRIGQYSMIGAAAVVIEGVTVSSDCIVGAGATVIRDLTEPGVYVGSPARRIR